MPYGRVFHCEVGATSACDWGAIGLPPISERHLYAEILPPVVLLASLRLPFPGIRS